MNNKINVLLIIFGFLCLNNKAINAQFEIGHTTITFNDPNRTGGFGSGGGPGRQIQTEIYYPADAAGTDIAVANGEFPVIVFGHGFVMTWSAYENIWEELVPQGYIMAFPRTEGGFTPSHANFGMDLSLVLDDMLAFNQDNGSLFFERLNGRSALMGHSMGGGSAMLAAAQNTNANTVICLAPAETNPSAIDAAEDIAIPALVLSGGNDGVTPDDEHHIPIYDALASECKYFVSILGGAHCYFANSNTNCDFGELTASSGISITRAEQQQTSYDAYTPWMDFYLKENAVALVNFENFTENDSRVQATTNCSNTVNLYDENQLEVNLILHPNPTHETLSISLENSQAQKGMIIDQLGRIVMEFVLSDAYVELNLSHLPNGLYFVELQQNGIKFNKKFIKR
jgi:predicted dienelactone hydrolase